jgi:hypothetical protein
MAKGYKAVLLGRFSQRSTGRDELKEVQADRTRYCGTGQTAAAPKAARDGAEISQRWCGLPSRNHDAAHDPLAGLLHAAHSGARAACFTRPAGFPKKPLLQSLFASLVPYLELAYCLPEKLLQWSH